MFLVSLNPLQTGKRQWVQLRDSGRGYLVAVAQVYGGLLSLIFLVPRIKPMKTVSTVQVLSRVSARLWRGFRIRFPHCFFLLSLSSSLHLCHCLQNIGQVIIFPFSKAVLEADYLRLGLKPTWQGLCAVLSHSVASDWDLSLSKTHGAWFQDLIKLRLLMSHCKKNSVRDTAIGNRCICLDLERSTEKFLKRWEYQTTWHY